MLIGILLTSFALSVLKGVTLLVSYINNNSFPHPLSLEDESHYLQIIQRGQTDPNKNEIDETIKVEQARNILIDHNLRLVAHVVKRFGDKEEKNDDLFSIGTIGLIKAIDTFNPNIGAKLSTYAARCITNEILMHFRKNKPNIETSLYNPIGQDSNGNELRIIDSLIADDKPILDQVVHDEDQRLLLENIEKLPILYRQVLQLRYGLLNNLERSQQEVANTLGISRSYVSRIEKKAIQLLVKEMKDS